MPIRDLIRVQTPRLTIHPRAFSTGFRTCTRDELQSVDRRFGHCSHATLGALYDRHGNLIEMAQRDGGRAYDLVCELDPPRVIKKQILQSRTFLPGKTLFLGNYMNLYGHFLVETMSRFWALATDTFDHYAFFPFVHRRNMIETFDFHRLFLQHFGITPDRMVVLQAPVEFEEVHVPERLCTINHCANIDLPSVYRDLSRQHAKLTGSDRIFLSRHQPYARISNVTEVEEVFRELDFEIIYPETLDLPTQMGLYAGCRVLAGFAGSALHNCLFCEPGTALIELGDIRTSTHSLPTQLIVNQASGVEAHYVPYVGSPEGHVDTATLRRTIPALSLLIRSGSPPSYSADFHSRSRANHYTWPATLTVHLSNIGDMTRVGSLLVDGHKTESRIAIEGLLISLDSDAPFGIEYRVFQHDGTWTEWSGSGTFLGSRGVSQPIRGYAARLTGPGAARFRCVCLGKFAAQPVIVEAVDGDDCTATDGAFLMGLQMQLRRRPR